MISRCALSDTVSDAGSGKQELTVKIVFPIRISLRRGRGIFFAFAYFILHRFRASLHLLLMLGGPVLADII